MRPHLPLSTLGSGGGITHDLLLRRHLFGKVQRGGNAWTRPKETKVLVSTVLQSVLRDFEQV